MNALSTQQILVLIVLLITNSHSLFLFYSDKQRAIKKKYRVSEKKLLLSAWLMGGMGAWIGMSVFRHKTNHLLFKVSVPISALLTLSLLVFSIIH